MTGEIATLTAEINALKEANARLQTSADRVRASNELLRGTLFDIMQNTNNAPAARHAIANMFDGWCGRCHRKNAREKDGDAGPGCATCNPVRLGVRLTEALAKNKRKEDSATQKIREMTSMLAYREDQLTMFAGVVKERDALTADIATLKTDFANTVREVTAESSRFARERDSALEQRTIALKTAGQVKRESAAESSVLRGLLSRMIGSEYPDPYFADGPEGWRVLREECSTYLREVEPEAVETLLGLQDQVTALQTALTDEKAKSRALSIRIDAACVALGNSRSYDITHNAAWLDNEEEIIGPELCGRRLIVSQRKDASGAFVFDQTQKTCAKPAGHKSGCSVHVTGAVGSEDQNRRGKSSA